MYRDEDVLLNRFNYPKVVMKIMNRF